MIKILLADDHKILREGLKVLLSRRAEGHSAEPTSEMRVVAEASDGAEALRRARDVLPDVVVMDVMMPKMNGIEATRALRGEMPSVRVVGLSMYANANFIYEIFKAGASAFLIKDCAFEELVEAVLAGMNGEKYVSECLKGLLSDMFLDSLMDSRPREDDISAREMEVLCLLADGLTNKDVAKRLFLSVNTVACHRQNLMRKLGLKNTAGLTKYALRKGYISL
ncbi:DNA-binding response regulator [Synergistales bacterium]|nr:DNA-binding response regulator [Synergistales bacterium]